MLYIVGFIVNIKRKDSFQIALQEASQYICRPYILYANDFVCVRERERTVKAKVI